MGELLFIHHVLAFWNFRFFWVVHLLSPLSFGVLLFSVSWCADLALEFIIAVAKQALTTAIIRLIKEWHCGTAAFATLSGSRLLIIVILL